MQWKWINEEKKFIESAHDLVVNTIGSSEATKQETTTTKNSALLSDCNILQYVRLYSAIKRRNDEPAILI